MKVANCSWQAWTSWRWTVAKEWDLYTSGPETKLGMDGVLYSMCLVFCLVVLIRCFYLCMWRGEGRYGYWLFFRAVDTRDVKLVKSNRQLVRLKPVREVVNHGTEPILFLFFPCFSLIFPMFLQRYRQILLNSALVWQCCHMTLHEKVRYV